MLSKPVYPIATSLMSLRVEIRVGLGKGEERWWGGGGGGGGWKHTTVVFLYVYDSKRLLQQLLDYLSFFPSFLNMKA